MICAYCCSEFEPTKRQQGGGNQKYCSKKCCYTAWGKEHPDRKREALKRYENKPESKAKKQLRTRAQRWKKYGWTKADLETELVRQNYTCFGCLRPIDLLSARVDHCHTTSRNRGLLCDSCNWGLGHLKDDPAILRRLMAYLERDRTKTLIYVAGALKNPRIPEIGNALRKAGFDAMDEWWTPGEHADENWQRYESLRGRNYKEALRGRSATNTFLFDRSYIDLSDAFVLVMPAGKSGMLELGYAAGSRKKTFLLLDGNEPERYDIMPNAAYRVIHTVEELIEELRHGS